MQTIAAEPAKAIAMGIARFPLYTYSKSVKVDLDDPTLWFVPHMHKFSLLEQEPLSNGCQSGFQYDSVALNPRQYLSYLQSDVEKRGARIVRGEVPRENEFSDAIAALLEKLEPADDGKIVVVNCTGLGARELCHDENVFSIRGQTILARLNPPPPKSDFRIIMHPSTSEAGDGGVTYLVPRPGTDIVVLGGTKKDGDWNTNPDEEVTKGILSTLR